jgi:hypothetical protein
MHDQRFRGAQLRHADGAARYAGGRDDRADALVDGIGELCVESRYGAAVIALTAQYISTGTAGAGTVKRIATFTMSYQ